MIAISKLDVVWLCHSRGGRLFSRGKFTEVSVRREDRCCHFFIKANTCWVKVFCLDRHCFRAEMWQRVSRTGGREDKWEDGHLSTYNYRIVTTERVTVTKLLVFGHVMLLCRTFLFMFLGELHFYCNSHTHTHTHTHTTSRGGSVPGPNFTLRSLWDFHTEGEAESWCRIPAFKGQCEWGYCVCEWRNVTSAVKCFKESD